MENEQKKNNDDDKSRIRGRPGIQSSQPPTKNYQPKKPCVAKGGKKALSFSSHFEIRKQKRKRVKIEEKQPKAGYFERK